MLFKQIKLILIFLLLVPSFSYSYNADCVTKFKIMGDFIESGSVIMPIVIASPGILFAILMGLCDAPPRNISLKQRVKEGILVLKENTIPFIKYVVLPAIIIAKGGADYLEHAKLISLESDGMYIFKKCANIVELYVAVQLGSFLFNNYREQTDAPVDDVQPAKEEREMFSFLKIPGAIFTLTLLAKSLTGIIR